MWNKPSPGLCHAVLALCGFLPLLIWLTATLQNQHTGEIWQSNQNRLDMYTHTHTEEKSDIIFTRGHFSRLQYAIFLLLLCYADSVESRYSGVIISGEYSVVSRHWSTID